MRELQQTFPTLYVPQNLERLAGQLKNRIFFANNLHILVNLVLCSFCNDAMSFSCFQLNLFCKKLTPDTIRIPLPETMPGVGSISMLNK